MIHVLTVHHKSSQWVDVQVAYLRRHMHEPYRVVANLEDVPGDPAHKFDRVIEAEGPHAGKLNLMAAEVGATADSDGLLMFLDGDAFPIADVMPVVHRALDQMVLIAVRRDENNGDKQPHPCFSMIRVRDWQGLRGDWTFGQGVPVVRTALGMANRIRYKWWKNKQIAENRRPLAQVFAQLETDPEFYRQFQ